MGHIAAECLTERRSVVREDLRVVCAAGHGDVGHAAVEQILCTKLGVHVDQHAICRLALARMAGHSIAVVEMQLPVRIELHGAAIVHLQIQSPIAADGFDGAQFAVRYLEVIRWRSELDAVALGKRAQLFAVHGHALLPAWIVGSLGSVLQFDCQPIGCVHRWI